MNTITATSARSGLFQLLKQTVKGHLRTKIASKEGFAVLLSEEEYEGLLETAELLSIKGLEESIQKSNEEIAKGELYDLDQVL